MGNSRVVFLAGFVGALSLAIGVLVVVGGRSSSYLSGGESPTAAAPEPVDERRVNPQGLTTTTVAGQQGEAAASDAAAQEMHRQMVEGLAAGQDISVEQAEQELRKQGIFGAWYQEANDDPALAGFKVDWVNGSQLPVIAVVAGQELAIPFPSGFDEEYRDARFSEQQIRQVRQPLSEAVSATDERLVGTMYDPFADELVVVVLPGTSLAPEGESSVVDVVHGVLAQYLPDQKTDLLGELPIVFREPQSG